MESRYPGAFGLFHFYLIWMWFMDKVGTVLTEVHHCRSWLRKLTVGKLNYRARPCLSVEGQMD